MFHFETLQNSKAHCAEPAVLFRLNLQTEHSKPLKTHAALIVDDLKQKADVDTAHCRHDSDESRIVPVTAGHSQTDSAALSGCKNADNTQRMCPACPIRKTTTCRRYKHFSMQHQDALYE
jgi:hypothetical protein